MRSASIRRLGHQNAQKADWNRSGIQTKNVRSSIAVFKHPQGKGLPYSARGPVHGIVPGPVLHHKFGGVGFAPLDLNAVDLLDLREIDNDPLRMQRIAFAGKALRKIWITLPISIVVAIRKARKTGIRRAVIACETTMRQRISIRVTNGFGGNCRAGEVSFVPRFAPGAARVPMPGLDGELGVVAIADGLPARSHGSSQIRLGQARIDRFRRNTINACPQRLIGTKMVCRVRRSYVDLDALRRGLCEEKHEDNYEPPESCLDSVQVVSPPIQGIGLRNITTFVSPRKVSGRHFRGLPLDKYGAVAARLKAKQEMRRAAPSDTSKRQKKSYPSGDWRGHARWLLGEIW